VFYDVYGQANVTIVGVVEDRDYNVRSPARMAIYFAVPQRSSLGGRASLLLDTDDATQARALVLDRVREIDPAVAPTSMQTIEEELLSVYALQHLASRMTGVFGIVALALVTISLHSLVMSIATARRKEIAIRTALGATRRNVFAWFGSEIGRPVVFGALLGTLGVWFAYRLMSAYIVGLRADDLGAVVVVLLAACGIAVGAALGPALWATRDAPYAVLRQD
jgi:ABC-type lipoprotein release transport system permease subunit